MTHPVIPTSPVTPALRAPGGGAPPAFPANVTLIDNFDRADGVVDAGAGAAIWDTVLGAATAPTLDIVTNQLAGPPGSCVTDASFGPNYDLAVIVIAAGDAPGRVEIFGSLANANAANFNGYSVHYDDGTWTVERHDAGTPTAIATTGTGPTLSSGHRVGLRVRNGVVSGYHHNGTSWNQTPIVTGSDANYGSGRSALRLMRPNAVVNDFNGGTF